MACWRVGVAQRGRATVGSKPGGLDSRVGKLVGRRGLRRAAKRLESVRSGRAGDRLQVIGGAGWSWRAVGRLGRVTRSDGVEMHE